MGEYRSVTLPENASEAFLSAARAGIDRAYATDDPQTLLAIANDLYVPMESRQFAKSKLLAMHEQATERREIRPDIDLLRVRASALGYGWDPQLPPGSPPRSW
jgi:hypothetical protein